MGKICSKCNIEKELGSYYISCPTICKACCLARGKAYRKTEIGKLVHIRANKKSKIKNRISYYKNQVDKIGDRYVIRVLKLRGFGTAKEIRENKSLIEIKRAEILIHRIKKRLKAKPTGRLKKCTCCQEIKDEVNFQLKKKKPSSPMKPTSQCRDCVNLKLRIKYEKEKLKRSSI